MAYLENQTKIQKMREKLAVDQRTKTPDGRNNRTQRNPSMPPEEMSKYLTVPILWLRSDFSQSTMLLLAAINQLEISEKGCTATNEYLGRVIGLGVKAVEKHLKELTDNRLIIIQNQKSKYRRIFLNHHYGPENKIPARLKKIHPTDGGAKTQPDSQVTEIRDTKIHPTSVGCIPPIHNNISYYYFIGEGASPSSESDGEEPEPPTNGNPPIQTQPSEPLPFAHRIIQFWNSLYSPNKSSPGNAICRHTNKETKTYKETVKILNSMANGTYITSRKALRKFCKEENIPISLAKKKWTANEIKEILDTISQMGFRSKVSLLSMLYNPTHPSGVTSWFLKIAASDNPHDFTKITEDPNPEITNYLRGCISDPNPQGAELQALYRVTRDIIQWSAWADRYCRASEDIYYRKFAGIMAFHDPVTVAKTYAEWCEERRDLDQITVSVRGVGPRHKSWKFMIADNCDEYFGDPGLVTLHWEGVTYA